MLFFETGSFFGTWSLLMRFKSSPRDLPISAYLMMIFEVCATTIGSLCGCWGLNYKTSCMPDKHYQLSYIPNTSRQENILIQDLLFYVHKYFWLNIWMCTTCMCYSQRSEKGVAFHGTRVTDGCDLPGGCCDPNPGPLQEQLSVFKCWAISLPTHPLKT